MNELGSRQTRADPCLYYEWDKKFGLIVQLSFINDMLIVCSEDTMVSIKKKFTETMDCDDSGEMKKYIGIKVSIN